MTTPEFTNIPGTLSSEEYNAVYNRLRQEKIRLLDMHLKAQEEIDRVQNAIDLLTDHDSGLHEFPRIDCPVCH